MLLESLHREVPLRTEFLPRIRCLSRSKQITELTQQVHEQDRLMIQVFKSVHLFFVKVLHFVRRHCSILVEVHDSEPVVQGLN